MNNSHSTSLSFFIDVYAMTLKTNLLAFWRVPQFIKNNIASKNIKQLQFNKKNLNITEDNRYIQIIKIIAM